MPHLPRRQPATVGMLQKATLLPLLLLLWRLGHRQPKSRPLSPWHQQYKLALHLGKGLARVTNLQHVVKAPA